jgi:hypothetical protein
MHLDRQYLLFESVFFSKLKGNFSFESKKEVKRRPSFRTLASPREGSQFKTSCTREARQHPEATAQHQRVYNRSAEKKPREGREERKTVREKEIL